MISEKSKLGRRTGAMLLVGTILGGWSAPMFAQETAPQTAPAQAQPVAQAAPVAPASGAIRSISVRGNQRLEPATIISYGNLAPGQTYTAATLDQALKDLYATELFADVVITGAETGAILITVRESPVINRIVLEGNKRLKSDKILPEIQLAPRQIFSRSKVRADVERIVELYKRDGRFGARVEPKVVQLDQNRVDLVFEIHEGDKSKVRRINMIGNQAFGDDRLRKEMYTRQAGGVLGFLKSNDTYDADRLAADQQKLRAFYLTEGYADFRVVSALAELTPDRRDFIITYVVEEGPRYRLGTVEAESAIRDLNPEQVKRLVNLKPGTWFDAKAVEDAVTTISEAAGVLGYAFADVNPAYDRDAEKRVMNVIFRVGDTPRVYVERIDVNGNTMTHDKVIRREFRVNEGDAFNSIRIKRSQDRLQSLGYFQENLEIKQTEGSGPDRVILTANVEEKATGQLQFSAGFSSYEKFILSLSVQQNNFRGMGQTLGAGVDWSRYSKSVQLSFADPYFLDKQILFGGQIYRRDYNSFNFINGRRNRTYGQVSTGGGLRLGFPLTEFANVGLRYSLVLDDISLNESTYYTDGECDPLKAGSYLCDELGTRFTSTLGYSFLFDNTNGIRATRGQRLSLSQDFAGLGGDIRYLRSRFSGTKFWNRFGDWIFSAHAEGGYIHPFSKPRRPGTDAVRITDRFFGPSPSLRGFDIRGIGPRILRTPYDSTGNLNDESDGQISDALGGRAYYMGRLELEVPVSASIRNMGFRPSVYVEAGSVFALKTPNLRDVPGNCISSEAGKPSVVTAVGQLCTDPALGLDSTYSFIPGFKETFLGNSASPRLSVGVGFNWISPFGPLRIDVARALLKQEGDDPKLFNFNVGTQF